MTNLGKVLVLVNFFLSLGLMIWAVMLFLTRTDLSDSPAKDPAPAGELRKRQDKLKQDSATLPQAEYDWRDSRKEQLQLEADRRDWRRWYSDQLALLENDPADPKNLDKVPPTGVQEIVLDVNSQPAIDPKTKRFQMAKVNDRAGGALVANNIYDLRLTHRFEGNPNNEVDKIPVGYKAVKQTLGEEVKRDLSATTEMLGPKGLHERLLFEKTKREDIVAEQKLLEPLLINTAAESQFSREREKELRARVVELQDKLKELEDKANAAGVK
jgi:hypothetical protein